MKNFILVLALSLIITPIYGSTVNAQGGYYISEEEYQEREAYQGYLESKADMEEAELEMKVAAFEEKEEKESAEADKANKRLLTYAAISIGVFMFVFVTAHLWQKYTRSQTSNTASTN